jgi:hypothetical protein
MIVMQKIIVPEYQDQPFFNFQNIHHIIINYTLHVIQGTQTCNSLRSPLNCSLSEHILNRCYSSSITLCCKQNLHKRDKCNFHSRTMHVYIIKFYYQLMNKRIALKGVLKFTLKQLRHVLV